MWMRDLLPMAEGNIRIIYNHMQNTQTHIPTFTHINLHTTTCMTSSLSKDVWSCTNTLLSMWFKPWPNNTNQYKHQLFMLQSSRDKSWNDIRLSLFVSKLIYKAAGTKQNTWMLITGTIAYQPMKNDILLSFQKSASIWNHWWWTIVLFRYKYGTQLDKKGKILMLTRVW